MPTGYTAKIEEGISFREFALNCSRAFGALISMRDESSDSPIPDSIETNSYYKDRIVESEQRLTELESYTEEQKLSEAQRVYEEELALWQGRMDQKSELKKKYQKMLNQVKKWTPPTPEHQELKNFMTNQIEESIQWDCSTDYDKKPKLEKPEDWYKDELNSVKSDINYYKSVYKEEVEQAQKNTEWITQLKNSLK